MRRFIFLTALAVILTAVPAAAQVGGVMLAGDRGILTAAEYDTGPLILRGGLISRPEREDFDWLASFGKRYSGRVFTMDLALDVEGMQACVQSGECTDGMPSTDKVDVRGRIGLGGRLSHRVTAVYEFTRSFNNGTPSGRHMIGGRVNF